MSDGLTLHPFLWRATELFPRKEILSCGPDGRHRYTYAEFGGRVRQLADALERLGVEPGDRVGTVGWNHHRHFEAYFAVPLMGAQLHPVNAQFDDDRTAYVVGDAGDEVLLVDPGEPLATIDRLWDRLASVSDVVVMGGSAPDRDRFHAYDDLVDAGDSSFSFPRVDEDQPAGMCYTSGTSGRPKGAEYTHKMVYAHALMMLTPAGANVAEDDVVMPVVPLFHVNSWELPYATTMAGATQVFPGPRPDPADLADLIESEGVTVTHGVPTVWIELLEYLDAHDADVSSLERIVTGGSAPPESLMRRWEDEHGVRMEHTWGMTETMSLACASRPKSYMADWSRDRRFAERAKQGLLAPGYEMRVVDDGDEVAWDGESTGELHVRGPTVVDEYYDRPDANAEEFDDGWLKTGDIVTVDEHGYLELVDRDKDVIKSGGEWISSIELENALMAHPEVAEAAVVAVPHDQWGERPFACVTRTADGDVSARELRAFLDGEFPRWWLPDNVAFADEVPKNATGKFDKQLLSERFADAALPWTPGDGAERAEAEQVSDD